MLYDVTKKETTRWGLKYTPSIHPYSDYDDLIPQVDRLKVRNGYEFSPDNQQIVKDVLSYTKSPKLILEIGVHRQPETSKQTSTYTFLTEKPENCVYVGVDIDDRSFLNDPHKNIHTIKTGSENFHEVMTFVEEVSGHTDFDIIMIDGLHSVNQVLLEWQFVEHLIVGGTVILHDTNFHPGPHVVFDAIDEQYFDKQKHCTTNDDWGIGTARRIR